MSEERECERHIFIVAQGSMHTHFMVRWLEDQLGVCCEIVEDPGAIKGKIDAIPTDSSVIIFVDAAIHGDAAGLVSFHSSKNPQQSATSEIALFNVPRVHDFVQRAFRLGVGGFFYAEDTPELLLKGVESLFNGEKWISREALFEAAMANQGQGSSGTDAVQSLTDREKEVLLLVCEGRSNEEIAGELYISIHTVKTHLYNVFKKIDVPNRLQAAFWGAKHLTLS